jgi:hypothetical protein
MLSEKGGKSVKGEKGNCASELFTISCFSRLSSLSRILPPFTAHRWLLATDYWII